MNDISIFLPDGTLWGNVPVTEGATHNQELMKTDEIKLSWNAAESTLIPLGSYIMHPVSGIRYSLAEPYYPQAKDNGIYQYQPVFKHELMLLSKIPFLFYSTDENNITTIESDWNFTGKGSDLMPSLVSAIYNGIGQTYTIEIDETLVKALTLSFANVDILTALNQIAEQWEAEWYTDQQTEGANSAARKIHFAPRCLHLGGGSAAYPLTAGVNIDSPNSNQKSEFYNRFYVFGSTRNIPQDYQGAQSNTVVNKRLTLNPEKYPNGYIDLPLYNENGEAQRDQYGNLIPADPNPQSIFTKVLHFEDIYPKSNCRIKTVHKYQRYVTDENGQKIALANGEYDSWYLYVVYLEYQDTDGTWKMFKINKSTYDKDENPNGSLIKGLYLSMHFNSGALEGREFQLTYNDSTRQYRNESGGGYYEEYEGSFELKKIEDNTIILPSPNAEPKGTTNNGVIDNQGTIDYNHDGDKVVVFNIRMPQSYYSVAYSELEEKAVEEIYELSRDSNQYTVKSNKVAFATEQPNLTLGRRVALTFGGRTIDTRVIALSTKLDRPFEQDITLSKGLTKGTISTLVTTVEANANKITQVSVKDDTQAKLTKETFFRSLQELNDSIFDPDGYFTDKINPLTIQTMMLKVGATSGNFNLEGLTFYPNYQSNCNKLFIESSNGKLIHYSIGEYDPQYDQNEPVEWNMSGGTINIDSLTSSNPDGLWYLYAQCSRNASGGTFFLSQEQLRYDADESNQFYYFLVGSLSSKQHYNTDSSGNYVYIRVLNTTYGTTAIDGRMITTGVIKNATESVIIDLDNGKISGNITFTAAQKEEIAADAASRVQVGGRNLVRETYSGNIYTPKTVTLTTANDFPFVTSHPSSNKGFTVSTDTQYTLSFWIKTDGNITKLTINIWNTANIAKTINNVKPVDGSFTTETWQKVVCTFYPSRTVSNNGIMVKGEVASGDTDTHTYYVKEIKLEKGTIATDWTPAPEDVDEGIAAAQEAADAAIADLDKYASDSYISPSEKTSLAQQKNDIEAEYTQTIADAQKYGISYSAYTTAYNNAKTAFNYFLDSATWENHISIASGTTGETYYNYFEDYYTARTALQNSIAEAIKQITSEVLGRNILHGSRSFEFSTASDWKLGTWRASGGGSGTRTRILASDSSYPTNTPVATDVWQIGATTSSTGETSVCQQLITAMEVGEKYTLSCYARAISGSPLLYIQLNGGANGGQTIKPSITTEWVRYSLTVTHTTAQANAGGGVIYVGHYSSIGVLQICGLKLEKGTKATDWCPNDADTDYLTSALAEASATFNSTTINGGLVLSKFIGVRDSSNNVVAGMSGTEDASEGSMPMIFAGASGNDVNNAPFRVNVDGTVDMSKANISAVSGSNSLQIANGSISLKEGTDPVNGNDLTTIVPTKGNSMQGVLDLLALPLEFDSQPTKQTSTFPSKTKTISAITGNAAFSVLPTYSTNTTSTIILLAVPTAGGSLTIPAQTVSNSVLSVLCTCVYTGASGSGTGNGKYDGSIRITITRHIKQGSNDQTSQVTISKSASATGTGMSINGGYCGTAFAASTASLSAQTFQFVAGEPIKLYYTVAVAFTTSSWTETDYQIRHGMSIDFDSLTVTIPAVTATGVYTAYNNRILADGIVMSKTSNCYMIFTPAEGAGNYEMIKIRNGNNLLGVKNGILWNGSGDTNTPTKYHLNPLALIVRLTYANGIYTANALYNPRNLTVKADRQNTGLVKVSLNIGHTSYSVLGSGINESNGVFVSSYNRTADYFFVELVSGTTRRDWNADIMVYDYLPL
ncbi:MAG: hypothetical protein K6G73_12445 [Marinilabiliaceae bacterium]|nr:hypothetical protein [Marinilabiliaceae bacterium]